VAFTRNIFRRPAGGTPVISTVDERITTEQVLTRWCGGPPSAFHVRWFGYLSILSAGRQRFR
jgi:hypothetical protein